MNIDRTRSYTHFYVLCFVVASVLGNFTYIRLGYRSDAGLIL